MAIVSSSRANFQILAKCSVTRARASKLTLAHGSTLCPVCAPIAPNASIKGLTADQVVSLGATLLVNNAAHLIDATEVIEAHGGLHTFQGWPSNLITDSGGNQVVTLPEFTQLSEEGILKTGPQNAEMETMLTPEESMYIQHVGGADIILPLDHVVEATSNVEIVEDAMLRSIRWLDRAIGYHSKSGRSDSQGLFAIIHGGVDPGLRTRCINAVLERSPSIAGFAIGGLGGSSKDQFWRTVALCASRLPEDKPRYCMGVGFSEDLLVCIALGIDIADSVLPTRSARFGVAFTFEGPLNLTLKKYSEDWEVIDAECACSTCLQGKGLPRATLNRMVSKSTIAASALTLHNLSYQQKVMTEAQEAILADRFPRYLRSFFLRYYKSHSAFPQWIVDALLSVGLDLLSDAPAGTVPAKGNGTLWDRA